MLIPDRLAPVPDRLFNWIRLLWFAAFAFAVLAQVGGMVHVVRDTYTTDPEFAAVGLSASAEDDGRIVLGAPVGEASRKLGIDEGWRILAIEGQPVPDDANAAGIAERLKAVHGENVRVRFSDTKGQQRDLLLTRSPTHAEQAKREAGMPLGLRLVIRYGVALLGIVALLASSVLLFIRRPRDPVALLISFAFLAMAASIDPPLLLWYALGWGEFYDALSSLWWGLLVVALAAFPDGRFVPRWFKWLLITAPIAAVLISLDSIDSNLLTVIGMSFLLLVLVGQIVRFRRLETGIERQQIKWAALGFAAGFVLILIVLLLINLSESAELSTSMRTTAHLLIVSLFALSFAVMPLGLMVSLIHYRLWEADAVISRSAGYAIVTIIVGFVWAATSDIVREGVTGLLGQGNSAVATTVSAMLAAGIFAPTQSVVLGWTRRRFEKGSERLRALPLRLVVWRDTESAGELGMRVLAAIADGIHPQRAAIVALTPTGRELIAARDVEDIASLTDGDVVDGRDPRFPLVLPLEDSYGPIGHLLLGPRSDGNRYNRDQRAMLDDVLEPLAESIRVIRNRAARDSSVSDLLNVVQERLARLEGGPSPQAS